MDLHGYTRLTIVQRFTDIRLVKDLETFRTLLETEICLKFFVLLLINNSSEDSNRFK